MTAATTWRAVIAVGPSAVCVRRAGAGECDRLDAEVVDAALTGVDDDVVLLDDEPIAVEALWHGIFAGALRGITGGVALVFPTAWPAARCETVAAVARQLTADVTVHRRAELLAEPAAALIVEIGPDAVCICTVAPEPTVLDLVSRDAPPADVADAVVKVAARHVRGAVGIDCPDEVPGATVLATMIGARLRERGRCATTVGDDRLFAVPPADAPVKRQFVGTATQWPRRRLVVIAALAAAALVGAPFLAIAQRTPPAPMPTALFVEGRVAVEIPVDWTVERITGGTGSARVQVTSPADRQTALHLTQAPLPPGDDLGDVSAALQTAIDTAPGTFLDYRFDDRRGDRDVISYREVRPSRTVQWLVFVDGPVRIGIGCQSAAGQERAIESACTRAVASARALPRS
ncbi:type VII secretion-associated protein [Mycobacterium sp. MYCO198283]|uniref:type VII secretion-associated protein n=1 Tax=Mycobacterium sp. MYCO198283 TaxID=2883505 RepID=UPI001E47E378|nr:type VII secretion-associated protein [Mycobacterium sp. MYCO198283]MCG5431795.1 type VII secretion-associated protein [Mycobacterium sp. MYCO198283]